MTIHDIGSLLYGPHWQTPLADALGVTSRTVRRWAAGEHDPPAGVWDDIGDLVSARIEALEAIQCPTGSASTEAVPDRS